jgi:hypothetical protein
LVEIDAYVEVVATIRWAMPDRPINFFIRRSICVGPPIVRAWRGRRSHGVDIGFRIKRIRWIGRIGRITGITVGRIGWIDLITPVVAPLRHGRGG